MAKINLLPWREEIREQQKKIFITILSIVATSAVIVVFVAGLIVDEAISEQKRRNAYLKGIISEVKSKINEIKGIESEKKTAA